MTNSGGATSSANSNPVRYAIADGDFCGFLQGFWKRNLEWRHFGGSFAHLRATNNVVFIQEDRDAAHQPNTQYVRYLLRLLQAGYASILTLYIMCCYNRFLKWSFGRTHKKQDLVSAYTIQVRSPTVPVCLCICRIMCKS